MKLKFTINELLFEMFLFFSLSGCVLKNMIGKWEPIYDTYTFVSQSRLGTILSNISILLLLILTVRNIIKYKTQFSGTVIFFNILIIFYYFLWTVISLKSNSFKTVFFESLSTNVIILVLTFSLGFDLRIWNILKSRLKCINLLLAIAFFIALLSFWNVYGIKWPTNASYKGIFTYWITSAWLLNFIFINDKKSRKYLCFINFSLILAAFITQSRAWVLQTLILLFVFFIFHDNKNKIFKIFMTLLSLLIVVIIISYAFPNITGNLFNRGLEDTRSGQYVVFFSQHNVSDLFFGLGLNASYKYLGNNFYHYFDNQFMFIMFHYGVLPVVHWLIVYFSLFKKKINKNSENVSIVTAAKYVGIFTLMAYLGLSTYYQIEFGYSSCLIMILFGKAMKSIDLRG